MIMFARANNTKWLCPRLIIVVIVIILALLWRNITDIEKKYQTNLMALSDITNLLRKANRHILSVQDRITSLSSTLNTSTQCLESPPLSPIHISKTKHDLWMAVIRNDKVSEPIGRTGVWEEETTEYLIKNIRPGQTIIELGANIGYYTNLLAKLVGPSGRIYSYECNSEVAELNRLSLSMNHLESIVDLRECAVTDRSGQFNFSYYPISLSLKKKVNIGSSRLELGNIRSGRSIKTVRTVALDEDLPTLANVDWLRMDIEGSEFLALKGAERIIQSSPNIKIITEWALPNLQRMSNVTAFLQNIYKRGFSFYSLESDPTESGPLSQAFMMEHGKNFTNYLLTRSGYWRSE